MGRFQAWLYERTPYGKMCLMGQVLAQDSEGYFCASHSHRLLEQAFENDSVTLCLCPCMSPLLGVQEMQLNLRTGGQWGRWWSGAGFGKGAVSNTLAEWGDKHRSREYMVLGAGSPKTCSLPLSELQTGWHQYPFLILSYLFSSDCTGLPFSFTLQLLLFSTCSSFYLFEFPGTLGWCPNFTGAALSLSGTIAGRDC